MRNIFKFFILSRLLGGGRGGGRGRQGCGCIGTIVMIVIIFFVFRACTGGGDIMPAW